MKICIDPGHGGYDPGAVNHNVGVTEKALSLKIAALLGGELASRGYDVFFTRELDTFIPLGFRTKIANNEGVRTPGGYCAKGIKRSVPGKKPRHKIYPWLLRAQTYRDARDPG